MKGMLKACKQFPVDRKYRCFRLNYRVFEGKERGKGGGRGGNLEETDLTTDRKLLERARTAYIGQLTGFQAKKVLIDWTQGIGLD